jgi:HlyD family secretion protein
MARYANKSTLNRKRQNVFFHFAGRTAAVLLISLFLSGCGDRSTKLQDSTASIPLQPDKVIGIGRIEPEKKFLELHAETPGIVTVLHVRAGDQVQRGDIILQQNFELEQAKVGLSEARIATQQSQLQAAKATLSVVRIRAANSRLEFERVKTLFEQDVEVRANFDRLKAEYEALAQEIKQREADVETASSFIRQYRADKKLAETERSKKTLLAPDSGILLSLDISPGSYLSPERTIGTFAPAGPRIVRAEIDELFADRLRVDALAHIRRQGETDVLSEGRLIFIGPSLQKKSLFSDDVGDLEDRRVREVWISLETNHDLLYGMRVECVIFLDKT